MPNDSDLPAASSHFHTTHWSMVRTAGRAAGDSPDPEGEARDALAKLCATYWRPLYAFIRRRGHDAEAARDLTQGFFASFLARDDLATITPEGGRFRSYLLGAVKHFLANERERSQALKRGGGAIPRSLDLEDAEAGITLEPIDARTPEADFDRQWAIALLARAMERLQREQAAKGRGEQFERLRETLAGAELPGDRTQLAAELGISAVALRVAVHRLRARYRVLLLEEAAHTLEGPQDAEEEIRHLFLALES